MIEDTNNIDSGNIHLKWLDNIYDKFSNIEKMEVMSREGCTTLMEFIQMPEHMRNIELPLAQYKNLRFFITEMKLLIDNLSPVMLKHCPEDYKRIKEKIGFVYKDINHRQLFLKEIKKGKMVIALQVTDFFDLVVLQISNLKAELIELNKGILYLEDTRPF